MLSGAATPNQVDWLSDIKVHDAMSLRSRNSSKSIRKTGKVILLLKIILHPFAKIMDSNTLSPGGQNDQTSGKPRTRQRAYKAPPTLDVPDIDEDANERKRVLNVLAQRRYSESSKYRD